MKESLPRFISLENATLALCQGNMCPSTSCTGNNSRGEIFLHLLLASIQSHLVGSCEKQNAGLRWASVWSGKVILMFLTACIIWSYLNFIFFHNCTKEREFSMSSGIETWSNTVVYLQHTVDQEGFLKLIQIRIWWHSILACGSTCLCAKCVNFHCILVVIWINFTLGNCPQSLENYKGPLLLFV